MVRHHPAKFGGHKHCGGGDCDSGDMFFVANEENSRCCRNFLKDTGWKHTAYIINSDSGHTHSIGQIFENDFCQSVQKNWREEEKEETRSPWRLKFLRSEPWICPTENQNNRKAPFLKIASSGRILESVGELSKIHGHSFSLAEAVIEMFLENGCTFYDRQIILLNIVLSRSSRLKMPKLSIKGIL